MATEMTAEQIAAKEATDAEAKAAADAAKLIADAAAAKALVDAAALNDKNLTDAQKKDKELIATLVQERLDAELAGVKANLDKAYKARDEALAKNAAFEAKERAAQIALLESEGKHKEAFDIQMAQMRAENEALKKTNTELSRDVSVRGALKELVFRNGSASDMAFREITGQLVQNADGQWVHRSGVTIAEFVSNFAKGEENSFLFKAKSSSGAGTGPGAGGNPDTDANKSLFARPVADVLKMAAEGKFGAPNQY